MEKDSFAHRPLILIYKPRVFLINRSCEVRRTQLVCPRVFEKKKTNRRRRIEGTHFRAKLFLLDPISSRIRERVRDILPVIGIGRKTPLGSSGSEMRFATFRGPRSRPTHNSVNDNAKYCIINDYTYTQTVLALLFSKQLLHAVYIYYNKRMSSTLRQQKRREREKKKQMRDLLSQQNIQIIYECRLVSCANCFTNCFFLFREPD